MPGWAENRNPKFEVEKLSKDASSSWKGAGQERRQGSLH